MRDGGAYTLIIYLRSPVKVHVGALGISDFPRGYYIYVGSALRGIKERVARHLRHVKRPHWRIDYLLASEEARVTSALTAETDERMECKISASIGVIRGAKVILEGFGSSDCSNCRSHLYYFAFRPYPKLVDEIKDAYRGIGLEPQLIANIDANRPYTSPRRYSLKA